MVSGLHLYSAFPSPMQYPKAFYKHLSCTKQHSSEETITRRKENSRSRLYSCDPDLPTVGYEIPDGAKEEPCDSVGHDEDEERAAPVEIHQCGEDIRQVAVGLLHVTVLHITAAVLLHVALPLASRPGCRRVQVHGSRVVHATEEEKVKKKNVVICM